MNRRKIVACSTHVAVDSHLVGLSAQGMRILVSRHLDTGMVRLCACAEARNSLTFSLTLEPATAVEFARALRLQADLLVRDLAQNGINTTADLLREDARQ